VIRLKNEGDGGVNMIKYITFMYEDNTNEGGLRKSNRGGEYELSTIYECMK
jgi:hypothetical protein